MKDTERRGPPASDNEAAPWADLEEMRRMIDLVMVNPQDADQLGESVGIDGRLLALQALATEAVATRAQVAEMGRAIDQFRRLFLAAGALWADRDLVPGPVSDR